MTAPPVNLEELERLYEAATPGNVSLDWAFETGPFAGYRPIDITRHSSIAKVAVLLDGKPNPQGEAFATLIVAAVNALPALLTLARQAQPNTTKPAMDREPEGEGGWLNPNTFARRAAKSP